MSRYTILPALVLCLCAARADAQDPPPPIGPYVLDVRGTHSGWPDSPAFAESRGLTAAELPGAAFGLDLGIHVYPIKWRKVTFGIGGQLLTARAGSKAQQTDGQLTARQTTGRLLAMAPQVSLNFGSGNGWSYLSGGIGFSRWSIGPEEGGTVEADAANTDRLRTINYGGGARWFSRPHVAFSVDVRFYVRDPGAPRGSLPGSPRTRSVVLGAGVSLR